MVLKGDKCSLVLTIFKGENFVSKTPQGFRCQIEAKCLEQKLLSGIIPVISGNPEPFFNFQLAWQFSKKQLRELRENKVAVKVRCLFVEDEKKTEIGYAVLYVKDAFPLTSDKDLDVAKAKTCILLGTKEPWKTFHPKLVMQMHLEDSSTLHESPVSEQMPCQRKIVEDFLERRNPATESSSANPIDEIYDNAPRVNLIPKNEARTGRFYWVVSHPDGCFQLNEPTELDDLYIFSTTVVSVSNFHLLWNGRSPKTTPEKNYIWQIKNQGYGCDIKSDPFVLNLSDPNRRTFIGDKTTARIRASAPNFCEYLSETAVDFHVLRYEVSPSKELINEEVMGICFAELKELSQTGVSELRATLEVVSEWGYPTSYIPSEKPELRVVFNLEATPGFFNEVGTQEHHLELGEQERSGLRLETVSESAEHDETDQERNQSLHSLSENNNARIPVTNEAARRMTEEINELMRDRRNSEKEYESKAVQFSPAVNRGTSPIRQVGSSDGRSNKYTKEDVLRFINERRSVPHKTTPSSTHSSGRGGQDKSPPKHFVSPTSRSKSVPASRRQFLPEMETSSSVSSSSDDEQASNTNNNIVLPEPGVYTLAISLKLIWLKCHIPVTHDIVLSYSHSPIKIPDVVSCLASPSSKSRPSKPSYQCFEIQDGLFSRDICYDNFSEKAINEPLVVELRFKRGLKVEPMFAFSMIPVGSIFLQSETNGARNLEGTAEIQTVGSNTKVGTLRYAVQFVSTCSAGRKKTAHTLTSPRKESKQDVHLPMDPPVRGVGDHLKLWQADVQEEFEAKLKEKERAYLKILAEEAASRDQQREKVMTEKMKDLRKKEKQIEQQSVQIQEREELVRKREMELLEENQKASLGHTAVVERAKLTVKRLEEEHKIEAAAFRRRTQEYESELTKIKKKIDVLEAKLEEKDAFINKLKAERQQLPEYKYPEQVKLLEQENKLLRKQITDLEHSRDHHKKQSQTLCMKLSRLQEERDRQLQTENESLRLQILASKEQKELKKERKAVAELTQHIKTMKDSKASSAQVPEKDKNRLSPAKSTRHSKSNEEEIERLTQMRSGLLVTGAYTQYDTVVKELERRILELANGTLKK